MWGGKRDGAGAKPSPIKRHALTVRLSAREHETLKELGGSLWLQKELQRKTKTEYSELSKEAKRIVDRTLADSVDYWSARSSLEDGSYLEQIEAGSEAAVEEAFAYVSALEASGCVKDAHDKPVDFKAAYEQMDPAIRKAIEDDSSWQRTNQEFYDDYCAAHKKRFGESFVVG